MELKIKITDDISLAEFSAIPTFMELIKIRDCVDRALLDAATAGGHFGNINLNEYADKWSSC